MSDNRGIAELKKEYALFMHRADLNGVPDAPAPEGFCLEWYKPGDRREWVDIHIEADPGCNPSDALYISQFGEDDRVLAERQCFIKTKKGRYVGTTSAWFNNESAREPLGLIHWVAVLPEFQGRGLAKPLLSAVLRRMRELGHRRAYLATGTEKVPAVNLYLRFGLQPWAWDAKSREMWLSLKGKLKPEFGVVVDSALRNPVSPFDPECLK